jgi:hypothetical protein
VTVGLPAPASDFTAVTPGDWSAGCTGPTKPEHRLRSPRHIRIPLAVIGSSVRSVAAPLQDKPLIPSGVPAHGEMARWALVAARMRGTTTEPLPNGRFEHEARKVSPYFTQRLNAPPHQFGPILLGLPLNRRSSSGPPIPKKPG